MTITVHNDSYDYIHPNGKFVQAQLVAAVMTTPTGGALGTAASPLFTQTSALQTTPDLTTLRIGPITAITASTALVAAVASTKVRVYRVRMNVGAANVITILDGATVLERLNFAGATDKVLDFSTRPWWSATTNTALNYTTSTTAEFNMVIEYTQVA